MATFTLKARDTRPIFEVALRNPDGSAHDLTGSTAWTLNIHLTPTTVLSRAMVTEGLLTTGLLRYTWLATDWEPTEPTDPKLPLPKSVYHTLELPMEYEVSGGTSKMTFPNSGHDKLRIVGDVV